MTIAKVSIPLFEWPIDYELKKLNQLIPLREFHRFFLLTTRDVAVKLKKEIYFYDLERKRRKKCENQAVYCEKIFSSDLE